MTYETAREIYDEIKRTSLTDLKDDLLKYARIRTDWKLSDRETRLEMDAHRTRTHNALIDSCTILARNQRKNGEDSMWRSKLTDQRIEIGDFACYVHCFLGIEAR